MSEPRLLMTEHNLLLITRCTPKDGSDLNGQRLTVQFARGSRQQREPFAAPVHSHPRPRRTAYRMQITGLPGETSWQVSSPLHYRLDLRLSMTS